MMLGSQTVIESDRLTVGVQPSVSFTGMQKDLAHVEVSLHLRSAGAPIPFLSK